MNSTQGYHLIDDLPPDMDPECSALCTALNKYPGIRTVDSCCGHGRRPYSVFFKAMCIDDLPPVLYWFDSCHCGHYSWDVVVLTDCGMSYPTFHIRGPIGEQAYLESLHIAELLLGGLDDGAKGASVNA